MTRQEYNRMTERQLIGRKARLTRSIQTGHLTIGKGKRVTITRKFGGFDISADACKHCGVGVRVTRVPPEDLELLPVK